MRARCLCWYFPKAANAGYVARPSDPADSRLERLALRSVVMGQLRFDVG